MILSSDSFSSSFNSSLFTKNLAIVSNEQPSSLDVLCSSSPDNIETNRRIILRGQNYRFWLNYIKKNIPKLIFKLKWKTTIIIMLTVTICGILVLIATVNGNAGPKVTDQVRDYNFFVVLRKLKCILKQKLDKIGYK